jgi:hypothetical protein
MPARTRQSAQPSGEAVALMVAVSFLLFAWGLREIVGVL